MRKSKTKTITEYYDEEGRLTQRETVEEEVEDDEATVYNHQWYPYYTTTATSGYAQSEE